MKEYQTSEEAYGEWMDRPTERKLDPHCRIDGTLLTEEDDLAEVYLDPEKLKARAGGQWVLVDDIPEEVFGPFLMHAECFLAHQDTYSLA